MLPARRLAQFTIQDYVRLEAYSNVRHEFLDGQIYAMAGGTPEHGARAMRAGAALLRELAGRPCNVYSSDVRVRVTATGLDTYPDVTVVCGQEQRDPEDPDALVNPILLVEVPSPSTEAYDRGAKLEHYKTIATLQHVLLVSHDVAQIAHWRREDSRWVESVAGAGEAVALGALGCSLAVDEVFRDPLRSSGSSP